MGSLALAALLIAGALALSACAPDQSGSGSVCTVSIPEAGAKQSILVMGDSISIGYTPTVRAALSTYDVVHSPCNANDSGFTADHVDEWLASRDSFEAIVFNNGLHDIEAGSREHTTPLEYEANLREVAEAVKGKTAHPLFVLTTAVLPGTPRFNNDDVIDRNQIAAAVMAEEGIPVLDLYSVSLSIPDEHLSAGNVHYQAAGYETLGEAVVQSLAQKDFITYLKHSPTWWHVRRSC